MGNGYRDAGGESSERERVANWESEAREGKGGGQSDERKAGDLGGDNIASQNMPKSRLILKDWNFSKEYIFLKTDFLQI